MSVLDHDDGAVNHRANRDGDAAEAHDVRADTEHLHGRESHQDTDRQHDDGDHGTACVQQEHDADERNDDAFFRQRPLQRFDRIANQGGAVIAARRDRRLRLVRFDDLRKLKLDEAGFFSTEAQPAELPPSRVRLATGVIETSNVKPVEEMSKLVAATRAYEVVAQVVFKDDAKDELKKVGG